MKRNDLFKAATAAVSGILAAYGGFFLHIQPPEQAMPAYSIGFASILGTIVYLAIILVSRALPRGAATVALISIVAVSLFAFVASGFAYQNQFEKDTFSYSSSSGEDIRVFSGSQLTDLAKRIKEERPNISDAELLGGFGGIKKRDNVWTEESVLQRKTMLSWGYIVLVVSTCATVFSLLEVIGAFKQNAGSGLIDGGPQPPHPPAPEPSDAIPAD